MSKSTEIDVIGCLMEFLKERDSNLKLERRWTQLPSGERFNNSWFDVRNPQSGTILGQVTLIYPGCIPPGLQYDLRTYDRHGELYCRKEWRTIYDATIFDDILKTSQALRDRKPVIWHKFFRYKPNDPTIHRVVDTSWPPKFM